MIMSCQIKKSLIDCLLSTGSKSDGRAFYAGLFSNSQVNVMAKQTTPKRKRITFQFDSETGREILVAGSFNNWATDAADKKVKVKQLKEDKKQAGHYTLNMFLNPGEYEYKFFDGNEWFVDPNAEEHKQNSFGTFNSLISIG